ncbi:MAG: DUF1844 domain-containing protein [Desulfobacterales bacterium]|jgi:hypothetical protein|nr:DUF1844 domain-containing protein [Desulfobacterales bacterium]MDD3081260.1 DUF1844 domain-containing protein [Desulfobacterales bacterium]MDD3949949.1 DUF1844 domain-containing protein [Desulfobacterales bacterium]MDY0378507.1 DUF1844 domain-containing protein [Desulfobacterales bacterium]
MSQQEQGDKGFTVKDRRRFAQETESVPEETGNEKPVPEASDKNSEKTSFEKRTSESGSLPEINFSTFVFSLNSSALVHLGVLEDPATGKPAKDLPLAKQTIDIIGMLEKKTRGNLTNDEARLLENILHELRLMYVKLA